MKAIDGHTVMEGVVVFWDGEIVHALRLKKVGAEFTRGVKEIEGRQRLAIRLRCSGRRLLSLLSSYRSF